MATITTVDELLTTVNDASRGGTPAVEVVRRQTLTPELARRLQRHQSSVVITPAQRARAVTSAREAGSLRFGLRSTGALQPLDLPPGGYDLVVALRLRTASAVLAVVQGNGGLPVTVELSEQERVLLLAVLRDKMRPVPDGADVTIGTWHLGAPTLLPVEGRPTDALLAVPYTIEVGRAPAGEDPATVTTLTGLLQHTVTVNVTVTDDRVAAELASAELPGSQEPVTIAADSLLQPLGDQQRADFVALLSDRVDNTFRAALEDAEGLSACPLITVPVGSGVRVRVQQTDARIRSLDSDGAVLLIGALVGETPDPVPGTGDPERLRSPRMPEAADLHARIDGALLDKLVRQSLEAGELQRVVDEEVDLPHEIRVDDAGVELEPGLVRIRLDVTAADICLGVKDVGVTVGAEYRFTVSNGRIAVERRITTDLDDLDKVLCALVALLDLTLSTMVPPLFFSRLAYYAGFVGSSPGRDVAFVSGVIDPGSPVPLTEALPSVEVLQAFSTASGVESLGSLVLRPDDRNTYLYLRVLERVADELRPLPDVEVTVVDQDEPRPADDRPPTVPGATFEVGPKKEKHVSHEFRPPRTDEVLASGRTDVLGDVRLRLAPGDRATTAGSIVTTTTVTTRGTFPGNDIGRPGGGIFDEAGGTPATRPEKIETHTTTRSVAEATPDIYFRLRLSDGAIVDTRTLDEGLFTNVRAGRIGAPEDPVTYVVSRSPNLTVVSRDLAGGRPMA